MVQLIKLSGLFFFAVIKAKFWPVIKFDQLLMIHKKSSFMALNNCTLISVSSELSQQILMKLFHIEIQGCSVVQALTLGQGQPRAPYNASQRTPDMEFRQRLLPVVKCYMWTLALYGTETWELRRQIRYTLRVRKYGAGEGWRRSVGPILSKMMMYYIESMKKGISQIQ